MSKSLSERMAHVKPDRNVMQEALQLLGPNVAAVVREGVEDYIASATKFFLQLLMEAEVTQKCGKLYERNPHRKYVRWGSEHGIAVVSGAKTSVIKPRIRVSRSLSNAGEGELEVYKAMNRNDLLDGPLVAAILSGVSTRRYASILQRGLEAKGVSKSSISRKTIAATKPTVDEFLKRRLDDLDIVVLLFDGIHIGNRQMIVCIGVTLSGRKRVLGVRTGGTENDIVCRDLIRDMIERGLDSEANYLCVIDGSKALVRAIHSAFGPSTPIQRCQEHKIRNVQAYVPAKMRREIRQKMQAAYNEKTERAAAKRLEKLRLELLHIGGEKAANALVEGLYETLTVNRLGVTGLLRKSLRTTNIIESAFASTRRYSVQTTNYQNEAQIERWAIRGLVEAESHFRPVQGSRQLTELKKALSNN